MRHINLPKINKKIIFGAIILLLAILLFSLFNLTGFLQGSRIDKRDLFSWQYNAQDQIEDTEEFAIKGERETCWILIHSYTATPLEMKELARKINFEVNDMVYVPKLSGHGEVPSHLLDKNISLWYEEVESRYITFSKLCNKINIVGSSLGAVIALRLAEEHEVSNLYILNPFLSKPYEPYKLLPFKTRTSLLSSILNYKKKKELGKINSPEGREAHISYWNMPYLPIKNSLPFIDETISNFNKVTIPTFIAFSENDEVAGSYSAEKIYSEIGTENKVLLNYPDSNHILLFDYNKDKLLDDIGSFELRNR